VIEARGFYSDGINRFHGQRKASWIRIVVVKRMLSWPASTFCKLRVLMLANSASLSCVKSRSQRSRRTFEPNAFNRAYSFLLIGTTHYIVQEAYYGTSQRIVKYGLPFFVAGGRTVAMSGKAGCCCAPVCFFASLQPVKSYEKAIIRSRVIFNHFIFADLLAASVSGFDADFDLASAAGLSKHALRIHESQRLMDGIWRG
jgi:hypothetical protein